MLMKQPSLIAIILWLCAMYSFADNYGDYLQRYKEWYGVTVTIPNSLVTYNEKASMYHYFYFGSRLKDFPSLPLFPGGPVVRLTDGCKIVMYDLFNNNTRPQKGGTTIDNYVTPLDGYMLNNCGVPWENWYLTNTGGVILDDRTKLSRFPLKWNRRKEESTREKALEKANKLRSEYVRTISGTAWTKRINCDRIYIVRIPHLDKVHCGDSKLNQTLKSNATECYGVDFFRADRYCGVTMLFFVNTKAGKTIDDYIDMMSRYISFDKDFVLK